MRPRPAGTLRDGQPDNASGNAMVKVVNFGGVAQQIELDLQGLPSVDPTATAEVLAGARRM